MGRARRSQAASWSPADIGMSDAAFERAAARLMRNPVFSEWVQEGCALLSPDSVHANQKSVHVSALESPLAGFSS